MKVQGRPAALIEQYHGNPWQQHGPPWQYYRDAMHTPWYCRGNAWQCHGIPTALPLPWHCHRIAMGRSMAAP